MDLSNIQQLFNNPIIGTGIIMTALGGTIYSLKEIPKELFKLASKKITSNFIYTVHVYEYDDLFNILEIWLQKNHQKEYKDVEGRLITSGIPDNEVKKAPVISYNQSVTIFTIIVNGRRIFISKQRQKLEHAQSLKQLFGYEYSIKGFLAKDVITKLLQDMVNDHYAQFLQNQVHIRVNDKYGNWDKFNSITVKGLEKIIIDPDKKMELINGINLFNESKYWYTNTSIPYKRTYCFHGRPGTGKTSLSMAIAAHTQRELYVLNPSSLQDDSALQHAFNKLPGNTVLLVEDIDATFVKREGGSSISFSCLLNCMDGAFYKEGLITCITTNHLEKLDPALLRPGRVDEILEIDFPKVKQIEEYLSLFYQQSIDINCDCENILLPMSAIQEICISNRTNIQGAIDDIKDRLILKPVFS